VRNILRFVIAATISFFLPLYSQVGPGGGKPAASRNPANSTKPPASKIRSVLSDSSARPSSKTAALKQVFILPASITLGAPGAQQRLLVEGLFGDGHEEDLTAQVRLSSSKPNVASVKNGFVYPVADGQAKVVATFQGHQAEEQVEVKDSSAPVVWSFRNQVLPVMTKMGCNSGACHGAAAGKNGFKLTLRGYDPELDYLTLTRQALGRRTERIEPAKSLILLKPTLTISHGGGQRFPVGSPEYRVMSGWIAAGMPPPLDSDPRVEGLEVMPREASLRVGAEQQILVRARFSDGHTEDVTRWAKFSSGDMGVANVDDWGHVKMTGFGEVPVTVWYQSRVAFARLRVPFPVALDEALFRRAARRNTIDDLVLKKLEQLHIPPSRPATDAEFLRRAYLDAAGIVPTAAEAEAFLADRSPDKRARLIDALLTRSEFIDYWAYKWSDLLLVSSRKLSTAAMWSYYNWIRQSVAANKPWDQFVREIVTATGNTRENGAANYYAVQREPIDISENLAKSFLGLSITCARCHNHPLEKWTQNDYYSMANLFSRVRLKNDDRMELSVFSSTSGEISHPRLGRPLPPRPLDAKPLGFESPIDRRVYFAQWLTSPDNSYFARALVNRVWRNFMGRGLVEAVDDLRDTNPPTNEELFNALAADFVKHGFDVRYLIRTIMNSAAYQTSAEPRKDNAQDDRYYSHYVIRRLPAEVLLDAISQVTQLPEKFEGYPVGMRAMQLPDTRVDSYFLTAFGRPERLLNAVSERQSDPSISQALHAINGDTLNQKLRAPGGTVGMLLKLGLSDQRIVDHLFLSAFSRYPTEKERDEIAAGLRAASEKAPYAEGWGTADPRRPVLEDLLWAMLTSKEFMFNH
jgi:hypothetical protein